MATTMIGAESVLRAPWLGGPPAPRRWQALKKQLRSLALGAFAASLSAVAVSDFNSNSSDLTVDPRQTVVELSLRTWPEPCEEMFRELAEISPQEILDVIDSGTLTPPQLTYAAEYAGTVDSKRARETLLALLQHEATFVREGAIYGLSHHLGRKEVRKALRKIAKSDQDATIREVAHEALEDAS